MFAWFERSAARVVGEARARTLRQFAQFGVIGAQGFVLDNLVVYSAAPAMGPYWAAAMSYLVVGSWNWLLNRLWTFRGQNHAPGREQLPRFLLANLIGFGLNRGTAFAMWATIPMTHTYLFIPLLAGTAAGMFANFYFSRRYVFS